MRAYNHKGGECSEDDFLFLSIRITSSIRKILLCYIIFVIYESNYYFAFYVFCMYSIFSIFYKTYPHLLKTKSFVLLFLHCVRIPYHIQLVYSVYYILVSYCFCIQLVYKNQKIFAMVKKTCVLFLVFQCLHRSVSPPTTNSFFLPQ